MPTLKIDNFLTVSGLSGNLAKDLQNKLTFPNPRWAENQRMGRWNGDTPEHLRFWKLDGNGGLVIPRGYTGKLIRRLNRENILFDLADMRRELPEVDFSFAGDLRPYQQEAVEAVLRKDFGTLAAPTGAGKTIMALAMIAARRQPALILVHTKELLNQWVDRITAFLGIPEQEIGIIGGGKKRIGQAVTVAMVQTLYKCADEVAPHIGHLVTDECHRTPSRTFTEAVSAFDCRYMLGLSATPWRRDGLSRLIFWHLGDVVHEIDRAALVQEGHIMAPEVIQRRTTFEPQADPSEEYSAMLQELCTDYRRNVQIASDVMMEASRGGGGINLVLSDRVSHCETLVELLQERGLAVAQLTGDMSSRQRAEVLAALQEGKIEALVATGQLIGEGFDLPAFSNLFLTTPVRFDGRVLQYLGRVLRPAPGKDKARVYDYLDPVGVLEASAKARTRVFEGLRPSIA